MADAIARCITHAIDRIDLNHPKCNPFSYITQTAYNVFRQRIKNEKKYQKVKEQIRDKFYDEFERANGLKSSNPNAEFDEDSMNDDYDDNDNE